MFTYIIFILQAVLIAPFFVWGFSSSQVNPKGTVLQVSLTDFTTCLLAKASVKLTNLTIWAR